MSVHSQPASPVADRPRGVPVPAGLTAGEVARRLGVAVTTLRTWHQRYGLGPSEHRPRRHWRYTAEDISRLEVMRWLTGQGIPAAQAARFALAPLPHLPTAAMRDGGGNAIAVGRAGRAARGLARAAMRLDASTMTEVIRSAIRTHGVVRTWDELLRPVLVGLGKRHAATRRLIEVEHLLSRCISEVLAAVPRPAVGSPTHALLACANEEQHSLPLEALAAALAERGCDSRLLGPRVPATALAEAVRRTGPAAVLIWSQTPATGDPQQVHRLVVMRPRPVVVAVGGAGWALDGLPYGVKRPASLTEALAVMVPVLTGNNRPAPDLGCREAARG